MHDLEGIWAGCERYGPGSKGMVWYKWYGPGMKGMPRYEWYGPGMKGMRICKRGVMAPIYLKGKVNTQGMLGLADGPDMPSNLY